MPQGVESAPPARTSLGIVGAGQLARMLCEAASALGLRTTVLAREPGDAAAAIATDRMVGSPADLHALVALAETCETITFDHELVGLDAVRALEADGTPVRPGADTLVLAVDKAQMRERLEREGIAVPSFAVLAPPGQRSLVADVEAFAEIHGWPVVLKASRGGYDGRGVWLAEDTAAAHAICSRAAETGTPLLAEELVAVAHELAVLVVRHPSGNCLSWPAAETTQVDGVCREVLVPGRLPPAVAEAARHLGVEVANLIGSVGVLAVEMFWTGDRLLVNELAARPHNSGHWSIEGSVTSQFENHLRGVLALPLGSTELTAPVVATVNVFGDRFGSDPHTRLAEGLAVCGAHVHLYGKDPRPGRKLGHVTVLGTDANVVRERAWTAARALGTPLPARAEVSQ